jgi:hypothetical protein
MYTLDHVQGNGRKKAANEQKKENVACSLFRFSFSSFSPGVCNRGQSSTRRPHAPHRSSLSVEAPHRISHARRQRQDGEWRAHARMARGGGVVPSTTIHSTTRGDAIRSHCRCCTAVSLELYNSLLVLTTPPTQGPASPQCVHTAQHTCTGQGHNTALKKSQATKRKQGWGMQGLFLSFLVLYIRTGHVWPLWSLGVCPTVSYCWNTATAQYSLVLHIFRGLATTTTISPAHYWFTAYYIYKRVPNESTSQKFSKSGAGVAAGWLELEEAQQHVS